MFEVTQVDVGDTPLALLYQLLLAWECWREEKNRLQVKHKSISF